MEERAWRDHFERVLVRKGEGKSLFLILKGQGESKRTDPTITKDKKGDYFEETQDPKL